VAASVIGTDDLVATSSSRGLAEPVYRVPSLWKVGTRGQFLHHGKVGSLREMFDPARLDDIPGHTFGTELPPGQRDELVDYLRTIGAERIDSEP
jgi:hypothetical protein